MMLLSYGYVYVAQIAIDANPAHAIKAIKPPANRSIAGTIRPLFLCPDDHLKCERDPGRLPL